jgi:Cohesin domain
MPRSFAWAVTSLMVAALLLGLSSYAAAQEVRVKPATSTVNLDEEFVIEIEAANVTNVYGFQFDILYNPNVLEYVSFAYGSFLSENGQHPTFCLPPDVSSTGLVNNCACTLIGAYPGVSGTGTLGSVRFRVIAGGQSTIVLDMVKLVNSASETLPCTVAPGIVYVQGQYPAVVTTNVVSNITYQSAVSGGTILTDGGAGITAKGVCWSTHENPTIADAHTNDGSGNWPFISQITGLAQNTIYHVRAYATNTAGTSYGDDVQFQSAIYDPPGAFSLKSPANGVTLTEEAGPAWVYLVWNASSGAEYYDVYFGTSPDPPLYWAHDLGVSCETEIESPGGPYYWKVLAKSAGGETWSSSGVWSFTTEAKRPKPFDLLSPSDGTVLRGGTVTLNWEASQDAHFYVIGFGTEPDPPGDPSYGEYTNTTIELPVQPGKTYYWNIYAVRDAGYVRVTQPSSNGPWSFRTTLKEDLLATWDGQGVYYRNSDTGGWVKLASPATQVTTGDLDCDGIDDIIGVWPSQGGVWAKLSTDGWVRLSSTTPRDIAAGDMDGDGCDELVGTWDGQGVYILTSIGGSWIKLASPATLIAVGNLDCDDKDDLIGIWPGQGGVWVKLSSTGAWIRLGSTPRHIAAGDMDGDGCDELLGTWDGQGVYHLASIGGAWVKMASPADLITAGDLDADGIDDLIGIWPTQGGVWVKYSSTGAWARLSSTARDISAGVMRAQGEAGAAQMASEEVMIAECQKLEELPLPMGGSEEGPGVDLSVRDLSNQGPGGSRFIFIEDLHIDPDEDPAAALTRIPGPGEPGFVADEQKNIIPGERLERQKEGKEARKTKNK